MFTLFRFRKCPWRAGDTVCCVQSCEKRPFPASLDMGFTPVKELGLVLGKGHEGVGGLKTVSGYCTEGNCLLWLQMALPAV